MRPGLCSLVLIGLPIAAALAATAEPQPASRPDAGVFYPLRLVAGSRLMIPAQINGNEVEVLLDSAAEATIVDVKFARQLGLVSGERVVGRGSGRSSFEAELVHGVTLGAVGLRLPNQTVAVADLSDVSRRLLGRAVQVILGREIFDAARLEIDVTRQRIRVLPPAEVPKGTRLELVTEHGVETFPARVEGHTPVRATFDLGNGSYVLVSRRYADKLGLLKDGRAVEHEHGGGLGGETQRDVLTLRSLEIAGRRFADVTAAIDSQQSASDLNVGVALLRHFVMIVDYKGRALWLRPARQG